MKEKDKALWRKVSLIAFLFFIVIGFSVPTFFVGNNQPPEQAEPRICQSDADCYLICDSGAVSVLCSQNLCQQNACEEASVYPYMQEAKQASLEVTLDGKALPLQNSNPNDFFVRFADGGVQVFSPRLSLQQVLEKAGMGLTENCLTFNRTAYCNSAEKKLRILVNDAEVSPLYAVKGGDGVEIVYEE